MGEIHEKAHSYHNLSGRVLSEEELKIIKDVNRVAGGFKDKYSEILKSSEDEKEYEIEFTYYYDVNPKDIKIKTDKVTACEQSHAFYKIRQKYPNVQSVREI